MADPTINRPVQSSFSPPSFSPPSSIPPSSASIHPSSIPPSSIPPSSSPPSFSPSWKPQILVLGPGGSKGYLELGSILYLEKSNYLTSITKYVGCSAGAIISLLLICGYSSIEIMACLVETSFLGFFDNFSLKNVIDNVGLISNKPIKDILSKMIRRKYGIVPTMEKLYLCTGKELYIVSVRLERPEPKTYYISKDTDPHLSCVDAVLLSSNIPFIFHQIRYRGSLNIDGAFGNPYPIDLFDDGTTNILGMYIVSDPGPEDNKLWWYFATVIRSSMNEIRKRIIDKCSDHCKHIRLVCPHISTINFDPSLKLKEQLLNIGWEQARLFDESITCPTVLGIIPRDEVPIVEETSSSGSIEENQSSQIQSNIIASECIMLGSIKIEINPQNCPVIKFSQELELPSETQTVPHSSHPPHSPNPELAQYFQRILMRQLPNLTEKQTERICEIVLEQNKKLDGSS